MTTHRIVNDTVFVVEGDCGDYYCEGSHVVAIGVTMDKALELKAQAEAADTLTGDGRVVPKWGEIDIVPMKIGDLL